MAHKEKKAVYKKGLQEEKKEITAKKYQADKKTVMHTVEIKQKKAMQPQRNTVEQQAFDVQKQDENLNASRGSGASQIRGVKFLKKQQIKRKKRKTTIIVLCAILGICLLVVAGFILPEYIKQNKIEKKQKLKAQMAAASAQAESSKSVEIIMPVSSLVPSVPEISSQTPEPEPIQLVFSPEEVEFLNKTLDEWAAKDMPLPLAPESTSASVSQKPVDENAGHNVALYFKDFVSGAEYIYNGENKFFVASLSKAPYAMYIYELVSAQQASLDEVFLIDENSIKGSEENSGKLKEETDLPKEYTLEQMLDYLICYSDTVAQRVLLKKYPASGYAQWAAELGLNFPEDVRGVTSGKITAIDAGVYLHALENYMQNGEHGLALQDKLYRAGNPMIRSQQPVAHKYGWDTGAYHDMAVVHGPQPYALAILTDKSVGAYEDLMMFSKITAEFERIMQEKMAAAV